MATNWTINGTGPALLGLAQPKLSYGSMVDDVATLTHLRNADGSAAISWDADPLFAYNDPIVVKRNGVTVFVGRRRLAPRFCGAQAESISYTFAGPWDWLRRRALLQNQAVVVDPEVSTTPIYVPQGFILLNQADDGTSVNVATSLAVVINAAIAAGVPIQLGTITGFDFYTGWDEITDLTPADAITRLLGSAPDAVVSWDYTTMVGAEHRPTIHIGRRANLTVKTLAIATAGAAPEDFGPGGFAEFETVSLTDRPDLVVPGVHITYRRTNTVNGASYLALEEQTAGAGSKTDENALVRTVQLAGSSFTQNILTQKCVTAILPVRLAGPGQTDPITPAAGTDFNAVLKFLGRGEAWLVAGGTTVTKLTPTAGNSTSSYYRRGLAPNETGEMVEVDADTSLTRELVEGNITQWMEEGGLNRKGQEQEVAYDVECTRTIDGEANVPWKGRVTRAYMATNATTRTYSYEESADSTPQEPTPEGLADALYAAMSQLQHEGSFTLVERECTLTIRPGHVVNLTGGRAAWESMKAVVQSVTADLTTGRTQVTLGWPRALTADDLRSINRANRLKKPAQAGLIRKTGTY